MGKNRISSSNIKKIQETEELIKLRTILEPGITESKVQHLWTQLKKMQKELEISSIAPIEQFYEFYLRLEEIRQILYLYSSDFIQLNQLHIEISTLLELLGLPKITPISEIISLIQKESLEDIQSLGVGYDSLFLKVLILHILDGLKDQNELRDLRKIVKLKKNHSEETLIHTWYFLRRMQEELALPSLHPIKQHYYFYLKLEEIRKILNLTYMDFTHLNQLYIEITNIRNRLKFPETTPISFLIAYVQKEPIENLGSIGIRFDSLLLKILLARRTSNQISIPIHEHLAINELDLFLFEILKSYGPLSRPELVELTDIARSSIYDSLQRLLVKGFVVQYSEKRSLTGRPTTVFDSLV
ncbi:MAG: hypothetical protein ACW98F_11900 [Candidatus Hodarchaeales archaeon]